MMSQKHGNTCPTPAPPPPQKNSKDVLQKLLVSSEIARH